MHVRLVRCAGAFVLLMALIWLALGASTSTAAAATERSAGTARGLIFDGNFDKGIKPWVATGGGVQCANFGTPSSTPRYRGDFTISRLAVRGGHSGEFTLPQDPDPRAYPLEACDLMTGYQPNTLPEDRYYGLMIYVPAGWRIPNTGFSGVNVWELHFQNIDGAPVTLQLHPDHVTLALETGPCASTASPSAPPGSGCLYRSNADSGCWSSATITCLPAYYAIPRGKFVEGGWNEILLHVHWAADSSGQIETWYRPPGARTWIPSSRVSGFPTVQWPATPPFAGCCLTDYLDEIESYTYALGAPMSIWLDDALVGTSLSSVQAALPLVNGLGGIVGSAAPGQRPAPRRRGGSAMPRARLQAIGVLTPAAMRWLPLLGTAQLSSAAVTISGHRVGGVCRAGAARKRRDSCRRPVQLRLSYRAKRAGTVVVRVERLVAGRTSREGRCTLPTGLRRLPTSCLGVRPSSIALRERRHPGWDTFRLPSRLFSALSSGTYLVEITSSSGRPIAEAALLLR